MRERDTNSPDANAELLALRALVWTIGDDDPALLLIGEAVAGVSVIPAKAGSHDKNVAACHGPLPSQG